MELLLRFGSDALPTFLLAQRFLVRELNLTEVRLGSGQLLFELGLFGLDVSGSQCLAAVPTDFFANHAIKTLGPLPGCLQ